MAELRWQQSVAPLGSKYEGVALTELSADDLRDLATQCNRNRAPRRRGLRSPPARASRRQVPGREPGQAGPHGGVAGSPDVDVE